MVEYTIDTLVHLYDSLNGQIYDLQNELEKANYYSANPSDERACQQIRDFIAQTEARLDKLIVMRNNIEELINRIFKIEIEEIK